MDEDVLEAVALCQLQQAVKVPEERMDADVAAQARCAPAVALRRNEIQELSVLEERPSRIAG
jgi:hypothetical protein